MLWVVVGVVVAEDVAFVVGVVASVVAVVVEGGVVAVVSDGGAFASVGRREKERRSAIAVAVE